MNNPMMPFGEEPSTLSLDMPQGLANILRGFSTPAVSTPPSAGIASNVGIGPGVLGATQQGMQIPSFQEGGKIEKTATQQDPEVFKNFMKRNFGTPQGIASNLGMIGGALMGGPIGAGIGGNLGTYVGQRMTPPSQVIWPTGGGMRGTSAPETGEGAPAEPPPFVEGDTSYAEGGMVGMEGMRVPPGAVPGMPMQAGVNPEMQAGTPMNPQMLEMQINQFVNRNPQQVAMIRQSILEELQSGELTPQELNMIVQLATVAAQNPEMYSYVRNFAIQQGIASEDDLPAQYDQGLVFVLLLAARAVQQDLGGAPVGMGQAPGSAAPVVPSMAKGGKIASSGESKPVIIEAHTGEYVIPKHVVDMKGKEFFDSLVEKYKDQK